MPSVRSRFVWANVTVQVLGELHVCQRGRLVDDRVGLGFEDCLAHRARVE